MIKVLQYSIIVDDQMQKLTGGTELESLTREATRSLGEKCIELFPPVDRPAEPLDQNGEPFMTERWIEFFVMSREKMEKIIKNYEHLLSCCPGYYIDKEQVDLLEEMKGDLL